MLRPFTVLAALLLSCAGRAPEPPPPPPAYELVPIQPGTFVMGGQRDLELGEYHREQCPHPVTLTRPFSMGRTEVTQQLWMEVMGDNPGKSARYNGVEVSGDLRYPVVGVSWLEAVLFANALSERHGLEPCYVMEGEELRWPGGLECEGFRLPTEAEWEYAARAGGDGLLGHIASLEEVCRFENVSDQSAMKGLPVNGLDCDDGFMGLAPVGSLAASPLGLHDMLGNVSEWTWDRFGKISTEAPATDPLGPETSDPVYFRGESRRSAARVFRGLNFATNMGLYGVAQRMRNSPSTMKESYLGVRLVRSGH